MLLLDRLLIRSFVKSYVSCLVSILSMYVIVDLFTNLDDFTERHNSLREVVRHIGTYYGYRVTKIYDQLSEMIVLLAATFTVALIQRNNELLPLLSAGVPTRRVIFPVLVCACGMLGVEVVNQELVISRVGTFLMNDRDDPEGKKDLLVQGAYEPNGIHIEGRIANRKDLVVKEFSVVIPESFAGSNISLYAKEARYVPPRPGEPRTGGWLLTEAKPETLENWNQPDLEIIDPGKYFLRTQSVDFETVTRSRTWFVYASTLRLRRELGKADSTRTAAMAVQFHMRLTRPLLGAILVLMGLSVILRDQNRNVFISAGLCLMLCGVFFAAQFACKSLGDSEYVSPAFAAWLPVLCFGPLSVAMFDAVHT